jgi:cobalt-zinc-cadmium efflux system outer membrane protein
MDRIRFSHRIFAFGSALLLAGAISAGLGGCVSQVETAPLPERRPLGSEFATYEAEATSAPRRPALAGALAESAAHNPTGALTLRQALALALQHSPDLAAFSWEVRVREAQVLQAGLFPNPEVDLELENFGGSGESRGFGGAETTVQLGQLIELAGKRLKRRRVAALERDLASWDYEIRRLEVFTEVVQAFVDVNAAQERLSLAEELLRLAEESLASVAKQVKAGGTSPVEEIRAEVAASTAQVERRRATAELAVARSRLVATWGSTHAIFDRAEGDLYTLQTPPPFEVLVSRVTQNPDLARWIQEVELREAVVTLEEAQKIPDVTAGGGVRHFSETNDAALVFGVSVPLPLFDRNQGAREASRRAVVKARHERRAAEVRVGAAVDVAYRELRASFDEVVALRDQVLPQAEEAYQGVREGYLRGLFRYVDVLDAQRTLSELRGRQLGALRSYHSTVAELERLIGEPLWTSRPGEVGS